MSDALRVLVVDDEVQIRRFLKISLEANGYQVYETATGQEALEKAALLRPALIILDLGLPDMDGLTVLTRLREWTQTPVIILSVRDADRDKIAALDAGAEDYLTKPFSVDELMARMRVAQRRIQPLPEMTIFTSGDLQVDLGRRLVSVAGQPIKLTPTEYAILRLLVQHAGRVLTHRQILKEVWGHDSIFNSRNLDVYVTRLREYLKEDPGVQILTLKGVGYRVVCS